MKSEKQTNGVTEYAPEQIEIEAASIDSLAQAVQSGVTTPALLVGWIDDDELADLDNACLVYHPGTWHVFDGECEIEIEAASGEEAVEEYVSDGDWGDEDHTHWVTATAWHAAIDTDGEIIRIDSESHTVTIEAAEPDCIDAEDHDWQSPYGLVGGCKENPGVYGHGGGVTIQEACLRCGCGRLTDTWAQNPSTGEQGLRSVEYQSGQYDIEDN